MWRLRHYDPKRYRARYGRYRLFFFLSFATMLLFALGEMALYGAGGKGAALQTVTWQRNFPRFFTLEAVGYLVTFLCGITVYAPFVQFFSSAVRGLFFGYLLSCLAGSFSAAGGVYLFVLVLIYTLFSSWLYSGYASFCSMVALRLFTDGRERSWNGEEKRMFGGTLFNSTLFCNTVNLRFLFMYTLLFLCAFLAALAGTLSFSFFRSRIG